MRADVIVLTIILNFLIPAQCLISNLDTTSNQSNCTALLDFLNPYSTMIISSQSNIDHDIVFSPNPKRIITNLAKNGLLHKDENIIFVERNLVDFQRTLNLFNKSSRWQSKSKFLVILEELNNDNDMITLFQSLWRINIYNAVVDLGSNRFYTWYPYAKENQCGTKFNIKRVEEEDPLIGKIPRKLHNCNLNIISPISEFKIYYDDNGKKGFIPSYLNTVGKKLGLKVNFKSINNYFKHQSKYGNHELLMYDLETFNIEGAIYGAHFDMLLPGYQCEYSTTMYKTIMYLICPPRRQMVPNLLVLFSLKIYFIYMLSILLIAVVWKLFCRLQFGVALMDTYRLFVALQTGVKRILNPKTSLFLMLVIWYSTHMNLFYQTELSSKLTSPTLTPKIKTIEDFLNSDLKVCSNPAMDVMMLPRGLDTYNRFTSKTINSVNFLEAFNLFLEKPEHAYILLSNLLYQLKNIKDFEVMYDDP
ncbi:Ionotropic receptor 171, partial [Diabrotica virgifera virgifera]